MKKRDCYILRDGSVVVGEDNAKRKAEAIYSTALSKLATLTVAVEKHTQMMEFIDAHIGDFIVLNLIRNDINTDREE